MVCKMEAFKKRENVSCPVHACTAAKAFKEMESGLDHCDSRCIRGRLHDMASAFPLGLVIAGFIYVFAILEYINYFHIQLSYDNRSEINSLKQTKRFKQACLSKDFKRLEHLKADGRKLG